LKKILKIVEEERDNRISTASQIKKKAPIKQSLTQCYSNKDETITI